MRESANVSGVQRPPEACECLCAAARVEADALEGQHRDDGCASASASGWRTRWRRGEKREREERLGAGMRDEKEGA
eukprot:4151356-Pleurochrysis_carterae.AAC.1